jgi:hypothetical protein
LLVVRPMPTLQHEAPLVVLREEPSVVPALLREALGIIVPPFSVAEVSDGDLTQALPVERRADLVVHLKPAPPATRPVLGIIVEVQLARDDDKRRSWPLYAASLHARLACQTCLVVLTADEAVARWAGTPIATVQLGSPFTPLVIGPREVPRFTRETATAAPWMALLAALVHAKDPGAVDSIRAAVAGLRTLPDGAWQRCYDLLHASLGAAARAILEDQMHFDKYEWRSEPGRRAFGEGRQEGKVEALRDVVIALLARHGTVGDDLRARVLGCDDPERLRTLAVDLASANDREAAESLIVALPASPPPG